MTQPETAAHERKRPALRLVDTKDLSRTEWLEVRKSGIGGSDAAAAIGLNPYMSPLELWLIKRGLDANLPGPNPDDTNEPVYWGTLLEPIVAASYTKQTGNRVRRINAVLRHPSIPFMLANIDREVIGVPGVQILECKTAGEFGARLWREAGSRCCCADLRSEARSSPHRARRRIDCTAYSARSRLLAIR
jgi:putative phage-type endonuclease